MSLLWYPIKLDYVNELLPYLFRHRFHDSAHLKERSPDMHRQKIFLRLLNSIKYQGMVENPWLFRMCLLIEKISYKEISLNLICWQKNILLIFCVAQIHCLQSKNENLTKGCWYNSFLSYRSCYKIAISFQGNCFLIFFLIKLKTNCKLNELCVYIFVSLQLHFLSPSL